jgi:hypothetical protein
MHEKLRNRHNDKTQFGKYFPYAIRKMFSEIYVFFHDPLLSQPEYQQTSVNGRIWRWSLYGEKTKSAISILSIDFLYVYGFGYPWPGMYFAQNHLTPTSGFEMLMTFLPLAKHFNDFSNEACTV